MREVNAMGDACPLPVVKAKKAMAQMSAGDTLVILVDNDIAVQNLERLAASKNAQCNVEKPAEKTYRVCMTLGETRQEGNAVPFVPSCAPTGDTVVVIASNKMGEGDEKLGTILMKGFLFALTQLEELPATILLYNSGAYLSTEGSASIEDLKALEVAGVEVFTCGTCLNHYGLENKLLVGGVTNMYSIVEKMAVAGRVLRP
ncbi:sulfurtransferase-like selenium metabolism protein YedF [Christensenellaceae bacterium OttesenSCG-928-M15]|nr:sulfurtransferase-like selenium metabolism protein YedF [Christensenellaceae bacterium OttesenSCG-928-M15]